MKKSVSSGNPKKLMATHLEKLRSYAEQTLGDGRQLTASEDADRVRRLREYLAIGNCFKLTEHEMVRQVIGDLLSPRRGCGCHSCKMRAGQGTPQDHPYASR